MAVVDVSSGDAADTVRGDAVVVADMGSGTVPAVPDTGRARGVVAAAVDATGVDVVVVDTDGGDAVDTGGVVVLAAVDTSRDGLAVVAATGDENVVGDKDGGGALSLDVSDDIAVAADTDVDADAAAAGAVAVGADCGVVAVE